jgi:integrase
MARSPRASRLETRTARLKLPVRQKPYDFTTISPGIALGYRRNKAAGVWVVRVADGHGANWTKRVGLADDFEPNDTEYVLSWFEAIDKARKLARGTDDAGRPATVAEAVASYERDLVARGGDTANAGRITKHLTPTLATKPVALLTPRELAHWRDGLIAGGRLQRASVLRLCKSLKAALNLSARRDHRIRNEKAWRDGLGGLSETFATRNASALTDAQVRALIEAAYGESEAFGLYVETAAVTGARLSQISRLNLADLQNGGEPRLLMPSSKKGRGKRVITRRPVPITADLAAKLKKAAGGRAPDAPLLLRADGLRWQTNDEGDHLRPFANAARGAGAFGPDGKLVTAYSVRHSAIIRSLINGVPLRICAAQFDTSANQIERVYSAYILDHSDAITRKGLLQTAPPPAGKVVPLPGRRS